VIPAVPAVAVVSANVLYGAVLCVVTGLVNPDKEARTFDPQVSVDRITRTAFVFAKPFVVQDSCKAQLTVRVQAVAWLSGPCKVNIPIVKLNLVTSAPGE
jgi:hypothetical protein